MLLAPSLAALSGIRHVLMSRGGPAETPLFHWEGLDGSKVVSFFTLLGYASFGVWGDWHKDFSAMTASPTWEKLGEAMSGVNHPFVAHWGCDLYAPNENLVRNVRQWNAEREPKLLFSTFDRYFAGVAGHPGLPVLAGELPSSWPNIESSWPDIWPEDLPCEHALQMAEFLSAFCLLRGWDDYPAAELREAWIALLDGMDHNQNSQGGATADRDKLRLKKFSRYAAERIRDRMAWRIAAQVPVPVDIPASAAGPVAAVCDRRGDLGAQGIDGHRPPLQAFPVVVFNNLSWRRDGIAVGRAAVFGTPRTSDIAEFQKGLRIVDDAGNVVPYVPLVVHEGLSIAMDIAFPAGNVPATGYRTWYLEAGHNPLHDARTCEVILDEAVEQDPAVTLRHTSDGFAQKGPRRNVGGDRLESRDFVVTIDRITGGIGIFDKTRNAPLVAARLAGVEERRGNYISDMTPSGREFPALIDAVELVDNHAVWCRVRIAGSLYGMPFRQTLTLFPECAEIHLENEIDWQEPRWVRMQQLFEHAGPGGTIRYGVPYGHVTWPGSMQVSLGKQGDEINAEDRDRLRLCRHWVDVGGEDAGLTIGCDHRMWEFDGNALRSYMMRGAGYCFAAERLPDGTLRNFSRPPAGTYRFRYVLRPRHTTFAGSASYRCGWELNHPLLASAVCGTNGRPTLPASDGLVDFTDTSLVVTAVKKAEDSGAVVVRAFESVGRAQEIAAPEIGGIPARETNLLEETREAATDARPFEIKSFVFDAK